MSASVVAEQPEMAAVVEPDVVLERVYSGGVWCEGPVWSTGRGTLVFSDVRRNRILALGPRGEAIPLRSPSDFANGNGFDAEGRLLSCEHLGRRIVREERDGRLTTLADRFEGGRLNSPNDLAVHPDGSIWFTDPTYGITTPEEGRVSESEQRARFVFRLDPSGRLEAMAESFEQPNGIVFSPDRRTLYVSDTSGSSDENGKREIRAFDIVDDRRLAGERVFATLASGVPDGLDVDVDGRVYAACGDGVRIWRRDGQLLGRIATPGTCGNLAFGGADRRRLFMCVGEAVFTVPLKVAGADPLASAA